MSLKNWILHKMNGMANRVDLPRSPVLSAGVIRSPVVMRRNPGRTTSVTAPGVAPPAAPHLGPYAPLIAAIREELEHFVVSYLRLHLAIAERDRYLLTSIHVRATGPDDAEELLRRFTREFRPEQIKLYLAKEVIGGLPNASAIDLSQFAGLNVGHGDEDAADDDDYSELLAELRRAKPAPGVRQYEVSLIGRWSELGSAEARASSRADALRTPLAGHGAEIAIEDAGGSRRLVLESVVPGRRYVIGKGEECDIVVHGVYASRRHCEIWLDHGTWWVTDAGSTNGIRVERGTSVLGRSPSQENAAREVAAVEASPGVRDPDCPGRGPADDTFDTDSGATIARKRFDHRRAHGFRSAHGRASRRWTSVLRRPLAQSSAGDRVGARGRIGTSHRHRRDRRCGRDRHGSWRQRCHH